MAAWLYNKVYTKVKNQFPIVQTIENIAATSSTITAIDYYLSYLFPQFGVVRVTLQAVHGGIIAINAYMYYHRRQRMLTMGEQTPLIYQQNTLQTP